MFYWLPENHNVKNFNKHAVVDLIRFSKNEISRTDLADQMGLTRAAITLIVNDLLNNGIILETKSRSTPSGRPPVVLGINPQRGIVGAIDMGATHFNVALADFSANIMREASYPFDVRKGPDACLAEVNQSFQELLLQAGMSKASLMAIGVGVPGPVIKELGAVISPPIMPGWDEYPIQKTFEKIWGCPVTLNNDAELGALGEWAYGAGRGEHNLAYIKVGSGIGAGFIINKQIYAGTTGSAGEIGHITVDENGPLCTCGSHGCLEAFAGGNALILQAKQLAASQQTLLSNMPMEQITVQEIADCVKRGDLPAQELLNRAGTFIGIAIAGLVNLFNPSTVIIGGRVAQVGDLLTTPIRQVVRERSLYASERSVNITTAMLGHRSSLIGAIVQAINIAIHNATDKMDSRARDGSR